MGEGGRGPGEHTRGQKCEGGKPACPPREGGFVLSLVLCASAATEERFLGEGPARASRTTA